MHHLRGSGRERPASSWHWGISSYLSQLFPHSEVLQYLQRRQKQASLLPASPPASSGSPCIPPLGQTVGVRVGVGPAFLNNSVCSPTHLFTPTALGLELGFSFH